jgi:hypothetical protein
MAVSHDPTELTVVDLALADELLMVDPDFVSYTLENDPASNLSADVGWSVGVLYSSNPSAETLPETVTFEHKKCVVRAFYEASCVDWPDGGQAALQFEGLWLEDSAELIDNLVVACGVGYPANYAVPGCTIELIKGPAQPLFLRGDCSGQGSNNIQDAMVMLNHIFSGTPVSCKDACDVNDDGLLNMVDPVFELMYVMGLGSVPPAPSGVCGADPTADNLDCAISNSGCEDICPFEDCSNGIDDDDDGAVDCDDTDCLGVGDCPGPEPILGTWQGTFSLEGSDDCQNITPPNFDFTLIFTQDGEISGTSSDWQIIGTWSAQGSDDYQISMGAYYQGTLAIEYETQVISIDAGSIEDCLEAEFIDGVLESAITCTHCFEVFAQ